MWDRDFLFDYDDPDLWCDPVRKWMLDWHSPVRGMECRPKRSRGGAGVPTPPPPPIILQGYVTEDFTVFYGTEDSSTIYIPEP